MNLSAELAEMRKKKGNFPATSGKLARLFPSPVLGQDLADARAEYDRKMLVENGKRIVDVGGVKRLMDEADADIVEWRRWQDRVLASVDFARSVAIAATMVCLWPLLVSTLGIAALRGRFNETARLLEEMVL